MYRLLAILSILLAIALPLLLRLRRREPIIVTRTERIIHAAMLVTLALMALSSIFMLAIGSTMHGWMLLLHMAIAPLFCIAIASLALVWAERTSKCVRLVLLAAFFTIITAMFTMMTWFGSDRQRWLLNVHRVSSMVLLVAAAAQAGRILYPRSGRAEGPPVH